MRDSVISFVSGFPHSPQITYSFTYLSSKVCSVTLACFPANTALVPSIVTEVASSPAMYLRKWLASLSIPVSTSLMLTMKVLFPSTTEDILGIYEGLKS